MSFLETFWLYLLRSAPYLMLGLLLSGIIHQFITMDFIRRTLGGNSLRNIFKAALLGIPLPLCSCSVIPTSVTLKKSGASNAATSAFLISTPESGVDSIFMTYALMDLPMTILRPVAAFVSAMVAGLLQLGFNSPPTSQGPSTPESHQHCCKGQSPKGKIHQALHYGFYELLKDISVWLTVGLILGAIIMYFVPDDLFFHLSQNQGRLLIIAIGIPFYICASATTPIAAALMLKGMSPGTALLLLLLGPATNISSLLILQKYIGRQGVVLNVVAITVVALGMSYLTDWLYQTLKWAPDIRLDARHEASTGPWMTALTIAFVALLLIALKDELLKKFKASS